MIGIINNIDEYVNEIRRVIRIFVTISIKGCQLLFCLKM